MTNYNSLYQNALQNLSVRPAGTFRFTDICDNPPARLGRRFRDDIVIHNAYPNVRCIGVDARSLLYEKF